MSQKNNAKMNVALVGCGKIAKSHMTALRKLSSLRVVALCDTR
jgi:predicted dehydrogenase